MRKILKAIRINDWWHHLLPPVLAFYFLGLLISGSTAGIFDLLTHFVSLLALAVPVAAFGFFLNDWTDINDDTKAGKRNIAASLPVWVRVMIMGLILAPLCSLLWLYPYHPFIKSLTIFEIVLLILYSCHPFRLKGNIPHAILLDALYSSAIPFLIAIIFSVGSLDSEIIFLTFLFGLIKGVRNILFHLQNDKTSDWEAGHYTIAHKVNLNTLIRSQEYFWLIESIVLLEICRMASEVVFGVMVAIFLFMLVKRRYYIKINGDAEFNRQMQHDVNVII